jgi:hypothetical protein
MLGERGAIDVRVECDGDVQRAAERPDEVDVPPRGFGVVVIEPNAGDRGSRSTGPKQAMPSAAKRRLLGEERHDATDRLLRRGRGDSCFCAYVVGAGAYCADEFGSPASIPPTSLAMSVW